MSVIDSVKNWTKDFARERALQIGKPVPFRRGVWSGHTIVYIHPDWNRGSKTAGRYQLQAFLSMPASPHIRATMTTRAFYTSALEVVEDWRRTASFMEIDGFWSDTRDESLQMGVVLDEKKRATQIVNGEKMPKRDNIVVMEA